MEILGIGKKEEFVLASLTEGCGDSISVSWVSLALPRDWSLSSFISA